MFNYKMTIAYDGTHYSGWQIQMNSLSIQQIIQQALTTILREEIKLIGSGRTDAGVHAQGQVAHFFSTKELVPKKLIFSLNGILPKDIRIYSLEATDSSFHARYSALGKIYHYNLCLDPVVNPMQRFYVHHVPQKLDVNLLHKATKYFIGTHDFTSFANEAHLGSAANDPIRTLQRLDILEQEGGIRLEFEGNGFLYKMVRNIVGTLLEVGLRKRAIDTIPLLIEYRDRKKAGPSAPAQGLFLMKVIYTCSS